MSWYYQHPPQVAVSGQEPQDMAFYNQLPRSISAREHSPSTSPPIDRRGMTPPTRPRYPHSNQHFFGHSPPQRTEAQTYWFSDSSNASPSPERRYQHMRADSATSAHVCHPNAVQERMLMHNNVQALRYSSPSSSPERQYAAPSVQQPVVVAHNNIRALSPSVSPERQPNASNSHRPAPFPTTSAPRNTNLHLAAQRAHDQAALLHTLRTQHSTLRTRATTLAHAYRNLGLLFHSFPFQILFHRAIDPDIRGFLRRSFLNGSAEGFPLPDPIHSIGTMEFALRRVEERLAKPWVMETEVQKAEAELALVERACGEMVAQGELLRQGVMVLGRMRVIAEMEGRKGVFEGVEKHRRRMKMYQAWAYSLPEVCWT